MEANMNKSKLNEDNDDGDGDGDSSGPESVYELIVVIGGF
jgi:hypothetical protein